MNYHLQLINTHNVYLNLPCKLCFSQMHSTFIEIDFYCIRYFLSDSANFFEASLDCFSYSLSVSIHAMYNIIAAYEYAFHIFMICPSTQIIAQICFNTWNTRVRLKQFVDLCCSPTYESNVRTYTISNLRLKPRIGYKIGVFHIR